MSDHVVLQEGVVASSLWLVGIGRLERKIDMFKGLRASWGTKERGIAMRKSEYLTQTKHHFGGRVSLK